MGKEKDYSKVMTDPSGDCDCDILYSPSKLRRVKYDHLSVSTQDFRL